MHIITSYELLSRGLELSSPIGHVAKASCCATAWPEIHGLAGADGGTESLPGPPVLLNPGHIFIVQKYPCEEKLYSVTPGLLVGAVGVDIFVVGILNELYCLYLSRTS